jgi:KaiC/GvpD/RAD55 family RecA-like ATPase
MDWVKIPGNDAARLQAELDKLTANETFEVLDFFDLQKLPPPNWLIEPILLKAYIGCLYGPTQTAKSFWILHQALTLADAGRKVLYLAGENSRGYANRMQAWYEHFGKEPNDNIKFIRRPVNFLQKDQIDKLITTIDRAFKGEKPELIIVDTLSKSFSGGDENDAAYMRDFVTSCERLRDAYGACVLVVHHTPKGGGTPRGSSVIECDFDTLIEAGKKQPGGTEKIVIYKCVKQKDAKEFADLTYRLVEKGNGFDLESSCVLEEISPIAGEETPTSKKRITEQGKKILETLNMGIYLSEGLSPSKAMAMLDIDAKKNPSSKTIFYNDLNLLFEKSYVSKSRSGNSTYYTITQAGKDVLDVQRFRPEDEDF